MKKYLCKKLYDMHTGVKLEVGNWYEGEYIPSVNGSMPYYNIKIKYQWFAVTSLTNDELMEYFYSVAELREMEINKILDNEL
jgi:hypothetical protein